MRKFGFLAWLLEVCCVLSCRAPISVYTICWHAYAHPSSCVTWFWRERERGIFFVELWGQIVNDKFVTTGDQFWCSPSDQGAEVRQMFRFVIRACRGDVAFPWQPIEFGLMDYLLDSDPFLSLTWRSHSKNETTIDRDKLNLVSINPVQDRLGGAHHRHLGTESGWPKTTGAKRTQKLRN